MSKDLGLSAADIGFAAGIFFLGYIVMQVPGNLIQYRVGARAWITRILIAWSLITAATAAVDSSVALYLARALLGFAEGGLPGRHPALSHLLDAAVTAVQGLVVFLLGAADRRGRRRPSGEFPAGP